MRSECARKGLGPGRGQWLLVALTASRNVPIVTTFGSSFSSPSHHNVKSDHFHLFSGALVCWHRFPLLLGQIVLLRGLSEQVPSWFLCPQLTHCFISCSIACHSSQLSALRPCAYPHGALPAVSSQPTFAAEFLPLTSVHPGCLLLSPWVLHPSLLRVSLVKCSCALSLNICVLPIL